ncbi:Type 1 glutamine amidotransferase-like domain-containing protein [Actinopolymorpha sp. B17G11]|uniref:Type 1 glutamine amidotransferase-like domain-containing protein n=1 Tax=Actinopolymorpha sp. B17G11 TaxID=3160861 RepID=UPI0032E52A38
MPGWVFLGGGGGARDSYPLDRQFARAIGGGPVSYWPVALDPSTHDYTDCVEWVRSVYEPLGVGDISLWTGDRPVFPADYRAIYIGGGNTYRLLSIIRRWKLLEQLREFVLGGGMVFGGSAGAALLGADITTIAHIDRNEVGLTDTHGADLTAGYGVFVHHRDADLPREIVWAATHGRSAIALTERSNAVVAGATVTAIGPDPLLVVDKDGYRKLAPGATSYDGMSVP